jgi:nitroimidazol reductase NimA-like FMN-containing flavoprotein (pyridoxamine 5'-phosphate oxidase superfamily)
MDQIGKDEALEVLQSAPVAHLGMIEGGEPYVTPMSFVVSGDRILFRTMAGKKLDALRANPSVCVEVANYDEDTGDWVSVIVRGRATEVTDEALKNETVSLLFRKYDTVMGSPLSPGGGLQPLAGLPHVVEVTIDEISGVSSGRFFSVRTRPGRL